MGSTRGILTNNSGLGVFVIVSSLKFNGALENSISNPSDPWVALKAHGIQAPAGRLREATA